MDNPHLIDRYIVSHVENNRYLVTNGDTSWTIYGKGKADTLCDTLNTKVDSLLQAMCTLTGDWSGYVKVIEKPEDLVPYIDKKGFRIQCSYCEEELEVIEVGKHTIEYYIKNLDEFDEEYKGKKVIAWGDICKRLGISEESYM